MTETQRRLFVSAMNHGGRWFVEHVSGKGPNGGKIDTGRRRRDALFQLEQKGIVKIIHRESDTDYQNGNSVNTTSWIFEVVKS